MAFIGEPCPRKSTGIGDIRELYPDAGILATCD
jgi:hypothetical protein